MKILLATGRYPWPPLRGDQLRSTQYLELLGDRHDVRILAPAPRHAPASLPERWAGRVDMYPVSPGWSLVGLMRALLGGGPLQSGLFWQPSLARELRWRSRDADVVVLLLARLAAHLGDVAEGAVAVVDFVDSLSLNMWRRARLDRGWRRPLLRFEAARMSRSEGRLLRMTRGGAVVCERDRSAMTDGLPREIAGRLRVVPLAVPPGEPRSQRVLQDAGVPTLVFTGNLGYFVNEDALRWFLENVWPALLEGHPRIRLRVAGNRPAPRLQRAVRDAGGELLVSPESLRPILDEATMAVAPLRCGSGVPVKILEAWAAGVPLIASRWAAAGTVGRDGVELLVADTVEEWIGAVRRLLEDARLRERLVVAGLDCLSRAYSSGVVSASLEGWLEAAVMSSSNPRPES